MFFETERYVINGLKDVDQAKCDEAFDEALSKCPTVEELIADNEQDRSNYSINIRRFNDFLSFEIERGDPSKERFGRPLRVSEAFSICFKPGSSFELVKGRVAGAREGVIRLQGSFAHSGVYSWTTYELIPREDRSVRYKGGHGAELGMSGGYRISGQSKSKYPTRAADDRIKLPDGSYLLIPHGLGTYVYSGIQKAL